MGEIHRGRGRVGGHIWHNHHLDNIKDIESIIQEIIDDVVAKGETVEMSLATQEGQAEGEGVAKIEEKSAAGPNGVTDRADEDQAGPSGSAFQPEDAITVPPTDIYYDIVVSFVSP